MADSNGISVKSGTASFKPENGPVFPIMFVCDFKLSPFYFEGAVAVSTVSTVAVPCSAEAFIL